MLANVPFKLFVKVVVIVLISNIEEDRQIGDFLVGLRYD